MSRESSSRLTLALLLALGLLVPPGWPAAAEPSPAWESSAALEGAAALVALDGPAHHFGFNLGSVLAQVTQQQTQVAAATPGLTGSGACTGQVGFGSSSNCTITGNGLSALVPS
jgi:hypothetical protein